MAAALLVVLFAPAPPPRPPKPAPPVCGTYRADQGGAPFHLTLAPGGHYDCDFHGTPYAGVWEWDGATLVIRERPAGADCELREWLRVGLRPAPYGWEGAGIRLRRVTPSR